MTSFILESLKMSKILKWLRTPSWLNLKLFLYRLVIFSYSKRPVNTNIDITWLVCHLSLACISLSWLVKIMVCFCIASSSCSIFFSPADNTGSPRLTWFSTFSSLKLCSKLLNRYIRCDYLNEYHRPDLLLNRQAGKSYKLWD